MKEQGTVSRIDEGRRRGGENRARSTHPRDDFNERLDAVVQRFVERTSQRGFEQPADEDYAMRWAVARHLRIQSRSVKGEQDVAA